MMKLTKNQVNKLKDELRGMYEDRSFPVFDTNKRVDMFNFYPGFINADKKTYIGYVKVLEIVGDNWAFDKKENRGRYPSLGKLEDILDYYAGYIKYGKKELPPVPLYKVRDMYHLSEGNHRLYVLKYLESRGFIKEPMIKAEICEFNYDDFLKESSVVKKIDGFYLLHNNKYLEYLEEDESKRFLELKSQLL